MQKFGDFGSIDQPHLRKVFHGYMSILQVKVVSFAEAKFTVKKKEVVDLAEYFQIVFVGSRSSLLFDFVVFALI